MRKGSARLPESVDHATAPPDGADLIERLRFEHGQIQDLWAQLQLAHRRSVAGEHRPGARYGVAGQLDLSRQLVALLAQHEAVEIQLLYPAVERIVGDELAEHARADHTEIREVLDDVDGEDPEDDQVFAALSSVLDKVLRHIGEEEQIVFPMLRAVLSDRELAALGEAPRPADPVVPQPDVVDLTAAERNSTGSDDDDAEPAMAPRPGRVEKARARLRRR
ncbi:MAG: hemerythrin domain-containing protein [Acidimicrobiales bacterium]